LFYNKINFMKAVIFAVVCSFATTIFAQSHSGPIPIYSNGAPGFESRRNEPEQAKDWWVKNVHNPTIVPYYPATGKANGAAVLICPGGGHKELVYNAEGTEAAQYLNSLGITAYVLKYRLFREEGSPYSREHTTHDVNTAMQLIFKNAAAWNLDTAKIGIMGFSAGGELAAWHAFSPLSRSKFNILIYPGPLAVPVQLPINAAPIFLLAATDDDCCSQPILDIAKLYRAAKLPVEIHLYAQGKHGFNMGNRSSLHTIKTWPIRLGEWLKDSGLGK
jgi:acetyl esterase/lipase